MAKDKGLLFLRILNSLGSREAATLKQIVGELGLSAATIRLTLDDLAKHGLATKRIDGRRNYYSITEKGRSLGGFNQITDLAEYLDRIVGNRALSEKVMEGVGRLTMTSTESEVAAWYRGAMERLDALVDERKRALVMEHCGYSCALGNRDHIERGVEIRKKYGTVEEYLEAEAEALGVVREGRILYQTYRPYATHRVRCYCSLVRGLPANQTISSTYCHCSKGFVKKFWEAVLERPVRVELLRSVMSGAPDCRFAIHM